MALYRQVQTVFWQDDYVLGLSHKEKMFYLWLITNPKVNQCGCYGISPKVAELEVGMKWQMIASLLLKFEKDGKIRFDSDSNEVLLLNWYKHNSTTNPKIIANIKKCIGEITSTDFKKYAMDSLSIAYTMPIDDQSQKKRKEDKIIDEEEDNNLDSINTNTHEEEPEITGDTLIALTSACDSIQAKERKVQILFQAIQKDKKLWNALSNGGADLTTLTEAGQTLCEILTESQIRKLTADDYLQLSAKWIHAKLSKNPKIYFYKCYEDMIQKRAV